eukprot:CAMPEP_0113937992 /NCGR_PEP_ID=MMETSP1339-20121228/4442_1 /TAXON_ID=94617 /ORGANISM="Fibrocapsa japonica" /LENGTH=464 /DNA_ID=CAMNT_0000940915 /DNA_START=292 /DNA_END=1686 /DNA_ORIENTATION=- /assembly_acc=CAM_ASM_000762
MADYEPSDDYTDPCNDMDNRGTCCTDSEYPVLGGVDLVHYVETGEWNYGSAEHKYVANGVYRKYTFWFVDDDSMQTFQDNAELYMPRFGGFDFIDFCSSEEAGLEAVVQDSIELTTARVKEESTYVFASVSHEDKMDDLDLDACEARWEAFFGDVTNGVFNTRCFSLETNVLADLSAKDPSDESDSAASNDESESDEKTDDEDDEDDDSGDESKADVPVAKPVSVSPVSITPVSVSPVSITPVSVSPVSITPVSVSPVSISPVSVQPVSVSPVSVQPVSVSPVSVSPVSVQPAVAAPAAAAPVMGGGGITVQSVSTNFTPPPIRDSDNLKTAWQSKGDSDKKTSHRVKYCGGPPTEKTGPDGCMVVSKNYMKDEIGKLKDMLAAEMAMVGGAAPPPAAANDDKGGGGGGKLVSKDDADNKKTTLPPPPTVVHSGVDKVVADPIFSSTAVENDDVALLSSILYPQ